MIIYKILSFIYGSLLGSFINVVIYRIPRNQDLVFKRSTCPKCNKVICWYELVPIFSYLILRGKCSGCKSKISFKYPLVEFIIATFAFWFFPDNFDADFLAYILNVGIFSILVAHFFIDIEHMILPDSLNVALFILLIAKFLFLEFSLLTIFSGALIGFGIPFSVTYLYFKLRGQVGLGGGDIKLYGILGCYLGPMLIIQNIFLSCFIGAIFSLVLLMLKKMDLKNPIPFGPFIIIVAVLQIFFSEFYLEMVRKIL